MSPRQWWLRQRRKRKRKKAADENQHEPLREFVYLDEVSVFSLLASRIGALATDFTDTESSSLASEVTSQAGVSTPVAKAGVSGSVKASQSSGAQVMRKSTVQSTFRELYGYVRDSLVVRLSDAREEPPHVTSVEELLGQTERSGGWVIAADGLQRGQLLEVEVALDADDTFRASTIFTTLFGFIKDLPQLPGTVDHEGFRDAVTGMRLLDGLLAGLVPVRGRSLDYAHVSVGGRELLVHQRVLDHLPKSDRIVTRPLYIVGVAEEELFWRDLRRVLFSGSPYRMLCRIGRDGVHRDWTPVKLTDVLEGAVPGLRGIVDQIPTLLAQISEQGETETGPADLMRDALTIYAVEVSDAYGHGLTVDDLAGRGIPTADQCRRHSTPADRRLAFQEVSDVIASEFGFEADRVSLTRLRTQAMLDAGMLAEGSKFETEAHEATPSSRREARYLDCEIIAVYW